jgi:ubiquinone/menaquinone biosynthesis C-methylase UbiE
MPNLLPIRDRLALRQINKYGNTVHTVFDNFVSNLDLPDKSTAISVSTGDGVWDYTVFKLQPKVKRILATDIVNNPVISSDQKLIKELGEWSFTKVKPEKSLPFNNNSANLIYHLDVIEHVSKPYQFLQDQYRILKKKGYIIVGTPNLHRPANLVKIALGKLDFPANIGELGSLGSCIHIQEFTRFQLKNMLEEVGFKIVDSKSCFFGICSLNIMFKDFPVTPLGQNLCQYHLFLCQK